MWIIKMIGNIIWLVLIGSLFCCLPQISGHSVSDEEICDYADTVNLTGCEKIENGSYRYDDILIPREKQSNFTFQLNYWGERITVPLHLRGCVCKVRPCVRLCCPRDQFFNNVSEKCEKITADMKVSWQLEVFSETDTAKEKDILEKFTIQVGLPCSHELMVVLDTTWEEWKLMENGTLSVVSSGETVLLNSVKYCYSLVLGNTTKDYILSPYSCASPVEVEWKADLIFWGRAISMIFLISTILVYLSFKELRDNLSDKLLICYLISLTTPFTMDFIIFSFLILTKITFSDIPCSILGFTCYFFSMANSLWLSVLCYNIWLNFKDINTEMNANKNKKLFIIYSIYAWLGASIATIISFIIQKSKHIDDIYKPGIEENHCWLNTRQWSAAIYFYGPNLIILIVNIVSFIILTITIYKVKRDVARMTGKNKFIQENAVVILRLFMIMDVLRIFDILSYYLRDYKKLELIFIASDVINAIQGPVIFALFVLKRNVFNLLKERFQNIRAVKSRESVSSTRTNFSKLQTMSSIQTPTQLLGKIKIQRKEIS